MTWTATAAERLRRSRTVYYLAPTWEPFHLYGFNPKAIKVLLAKYGFSIEELHVRAMAMIPSHQGDRRDAIRAFIGQQLIKVGNVTRSAPNMDLWARLS